MRTHRTQHVAASKNQRTQVPPQKAARSVTRHPHFHSISRPQRLFEKSSHGAAAFYQIPTVKKAKTGHPHYEMNFSSNKDCRLGIPVHDGIAARITIFTSTQRHGCVLRQHHRTQRQPSPAQTGGTDEKLDRSRFSLGTTGSASADLRTRSRFTNDRPAHQGQCCDHPARVESRSWTPHWPSQCHPNEKNRAAFAKLPRWRAAVLSTADYLHTLVRFT
jgi:hypothetical protein